MKVYAYGARAPFENAQLVHDQFRLACTYQRVLVFNERRRRAVVDRLYQRACPTEWANFEAAGKAVIEAIDAVRVLRTRPGDMLEPNEEMKIEVKEASKVAKERLAAAREAEKVARQAWYDAKKKATPKLRTRLRMCDRGMQARNKVLYARAGSVGLAWGTRLKTFESAERAAEAARKEGGLPHVPRFDGGGTISVQLQGKSGIEDKFGLAPKDALSGRDTRFRLESVDAGTWQMLQGKNAFVGKKSGNPLPQPNPNSNRSKRMKAAGGYVVVRLRIGSDGRAPVWAAFPVIMLRPLPENAPIKWAQIHARRIGPRTEWRLLITIDDELPALKPGGKTLAVNLGWRNLPNDDGLRVAYAVGSDGYEEEIRVPPAYVSGVAHVDSLRSIRDKMFEDAKKLLLDWREEGERPEWFMTATRYVDQWRSQKRLVGLLRQWRDQRFKGDERVWETFAKWLKQDKHLWFWECDEREKLLKMRKDFYRKVAIRFASNYDKVIVTDMDLRDFAELPKPEDAADTEGRVQRRSRMLAAPSELRGVIKNTCAARGAAFEEVEGKYKTQTCNACGIVFAFAAKQDLEHTCECGARWDQDANHCRNLLASGGVVRGGGGSLAPSVKSDGSDGSEKRGRWQKRRSNKDTQIVENNKKSA